MFAPDGCIFGKGSRARVKSSNEDMSDYSTKIFTNSQIKSASLLEMRIIIIDNSNDKISNNRFKLS